MSGPAFPVESSIDEAGSGLVKGWAWMPDVPARCLVIDVFLDGHKALSLRADQFRPDLLAAGKRGGRCGFSLSVPAALCAAPLVLVSLREQESGVELTGSPFELLNEAAGLDEGSRAFLAGRVQALDARTPRAVLDGHAAFLLQQLDRVLAVSRAAAEARQEELRHWAALFEASPDGSVMGGLLAAAAQRYGELHLPTSDAPELSIVIPVRDGFASTHRCLSRIAEHPPGRPFEVVLVDDLSTDETILASMLLGGVRLVRNARNLGFVGAVTAGAAAARGRLLMLLHNDAEVRPGTFDLLCETLDADAGIGVAGARLLFPDGRLQSCGGIVGRLGDVAEYGRGEDPERPEFRFLRDADTVPGVALMVRRDAWDAVDGLSAEYAPAFHEDADLCFKVREAGFRVVVQPAATVMHHEGASIGQDPPGSGARRHQRANLLRFAARWAGVLANHAPSGTAAPTAAAERLIARRALFIGDGVPTPDQDAASIAALDHMRALMRLGFHVHFVPSENMARVSPYTEALERVGIQCHAAPYQRSVEEVLRDYAGQFALVYLHRTGNARYVSMARARNPAARILLNLADAHHGGVLEEGTLLKDRALVSRAHRLRREEAEACLSADVTLTHSDTETAALRAEVPSASVMTVRWTVRPNPTPQPFGTRSGIAFIGSLRPANLDGAEWLLRAVMPLVWRQAPDLVLHLVGRHVEAEAVRSLAEESGTRVRCHGFVPDLGAVLSGLRLTVAPLRFCAGLRGKLLGSMAAGLPCIGTRCTAEGIGLPPALDGLVTDDAARFAQLIVTYHADADLNEAAARAGLRFIEETCSADRVEAGLARAIRPREGRPGVAPAPRRRSAEGR